MAKLENLKGKPAKAAKCREFDIVLVLEYFRSATPYLCIIKYLGSNCRIGLYLAPTEPKRIKINGSAHKRFVRKCIEFGATVVNDSLVDCKLLIVQQRPYPDDVAKQIMGHIRAKKKVGYLSLAGAGSDAHDRFLKQFQIDKVYVPNRRFFEYLLRHRQAKSTYSHVDVIQVGLPFSRYPIFPEFEIDYIIASPTLFSFHSEQDKHTYLRNVLNLLDQIGPNATIAYKPHNGHGRDSLQPRGYTQLGAILSHLQGVENLLIKLLSIFAHSLVKRFIEKTLTGIFFSRMIRRVIPLKNLTSSSDFAIEAFLPRVKYGVIGGLSNTIWGSLYFGIKYYNCVDETKQNRQAVNSMLGKNSSILLDLNLAFFSVPCCHGQLDISTHHVVTEEDMKGDLIDAIRNDLQS